jgi:UDP-glucose 4-epimerase
MSVQRRVLITGGMGFVGGHLSEALLCNGDHVTALDNLTTGRWENISHLLDNPSFRTVVGDVEDRVVLDRLVSESDLVIHLAAVVGVELIVLDPIRTIETNIHGTSAVLAATNRYRVKTLIASTSEVYGKSPQLPFQELSDVVLGSTAKNRWAYAASKMVDEFLGLAYHQQHGLPVVVFRLFNTVGPRQSGQYGMVVPRFVQAALDDREIPIHGDGTQSRTFLHVHDAVDAIRRLAENDDAVGKVFNVGSLNVITIERLAERVLERIDMWRGASGGRFADRVRYIPYEVAYEPGFEDMHSRRPDTTRIAALTGWTPTRSLDEILDDVIADRVIARDRALVQVR